MCTAFCASVSPSFSVVGRSLDYDQPSTFTEQQTPSGTTFQSVLNNGTSWVSTQGIYTFDFAGGTYPVPFDGLNQVGLGISGNMATAQYPTNTFPVTISSDDMVNWVLSQASNIGEAATLMSTVNIDSPWQYHYVVFDNTGQSLVVEYENGEAVMYFNESSVLTNNPSLHFQLANQDTFAHIRNWYPEAKLPDQPDQFHGQGMLGLPGDWMSPGRFTRMTRTLEYCLGQIDPTNNQDQVFFVKRLLESASLLKGVDLGKSKDGSPIYTQIQIVKDLVNSVVYWREYDEEGWQTQTIAW